MKIFFLGTNGWYSTNEGLTPSILIDNNEAYIILDAGGGIHKLDNLIHDKEKPIYLFLSHFHLDHIIGLHILTKFNFKQGLTIFGKKGIKKTLDLFLNPPFTVKLSNIPYKIEIEELEEGTYNSPINLECRLLPHSDPTMGYRFQIDGKVITYCTDTGQHENLVYLSKESDVVILECAHSPMETRIDWPHLNPSEAAEIAKKAKAKKLLLTHFTANRYPTRIERIRAQNIAKQIFKETIAAYDDMVYQLD
jgi:ribonuclease BN (tRNA processing enzyme)